MTETKAIIFDCFNVLCAPPIFGWYRKHAESKGIIDEGLLAFLEEFDLGIKNEMDVAKRLAAYEGRDPVEVRGEIDELAIMDPCMITMLKKLKENGYRLGLLSNGHGDFFRRKLCVDYPEFKTLFDSFIVSSDVKMVKPHSDIFHYALKDIGSTPEETVFIDDNEKNIEAACGVGIQGILFTDPEKLVTDLQAAGIRL